MKYFYHATDINNLGSILSNGLVPGNDGIVYLAETEIDALRFVYFRNYDTVLVVKVKILKSMENDITETFDHSFSFFKCKAFGCNKVIKPEYLSDFKKYSLYTEGK